MTACRDCGAEPALWDQRCYACDKADLLSPVERAWRMPDDNRTPGRCRTCGVASGRHVRVDE